MGRFSTALLTACVLTGSALGQGPAVTPEVVLVGAPDPLPASAFGLGDGGFASNERGELAWHERACITPGGATIECLAVGVKLTMPGGRELLVAPDGWLHLRGGEKAGPFAGGMELRLGDGTSVRITLNPSQQDRLRDVVVIADDEALQPWRRGSAARERARIATWPGIRMICAGDGGHIYRAIALGPLVTLDRVLVPDAAAETAPTERIALLIEPLQRSLQRMPRQHRTTEAAVRGAVGAIEAIAARREEVWIDGLGLPRIDEATMRWLLPDRSELLLSLRDSEPRLYLYETGMHRPLVEWRLGISPAAFLSNPHELQPDSSSVHGNGSRLEWFATDLQAKSELLERAQAIAVLHRLRHDQDAERRRKR
ncbi:MAG: hypothetical protein RL398_1220 [Planctomycetota bacterium]|jgi:hypothetical protein